MKIKSLSFFAFLFSILCFSQNKTKIEGFVFLNASKLPLEYANIGVNGHPIGTITNKDGYFALDVNAEILNEKITISFVGFSNVVIDIKDFHEKKSFYLKENIYSLNEVVIGSNKSKTFSIGSKSTSKNIVTGWSGGDGKGGERGILIKNNKKFTINTLNFHVAQNDFDSLYVRLHIRKLVNKIPTESILNENIIIPVKIKSGWVSKDLSSYNIILDAPSVVSLEWITSFGQNKSVKNFLISATFPKGTLYAKKASADNWIIKKFFSPSIYVVANEFND